MKLRAIFLAVLTVVSVSARAQRSSDPLAPIVQCVSAGRFAVLATDRLPDDVKARSVSTPDGDRRVSMSDGYRVMLATAQGEPFVNLKIEQSELRFAAEDRSTVEAQMQMFSANATQPPLALVRRSQDGVDVLGLDQPNLDKPGPVSFYSTFLPTRSLIATMYVLNQAPDVRAFASYAEYIALRDQALKLVTGCLHASGPSHT